MEWDAPITPTVVEEQLRHDLGLPRAMEVAVSLVDLSTYDLLLETREDLPLSNEQTNIIFSGLPETPEDLPLTDHPTCMDL